MAQHLHLVVTCTDSKSLSPPDQLRLRSLEVEPGRPPSPEMWLERLEEIKAPSVPAERLYKGGLWAGALRLRERARATGRGVSLWVASAGYGLVSADKALKPYGATFSPNSRDFVGRGRPTLRASEDARAWWSALTRLRGEAPTSIEHLARSAMEDELLVVMSRAYVDACHGDLARAMAVHEQAVLVSAGAGAVTGSAGAPEFDARVQGADRPLDGSRVSLNVRVAEHLVATVGASPVDRRSADEIIGRLMGELPPPVSYAHRRHVTDEEVRTFVRRALAENPEATHSSLLRKLRDERVWACEQRRFRDLFREVRADMVETPA